MFSKGTYKLVVISTETINKPENMHERRNSCVCCERNWPSQTSIYMLLPPTATLVVSVRPYRIMLRNGSTLNYHFNLWSRAATKQDASLVYAQQWTEEADNKSQKRCMLRRVGCWPYLFRNVNFTVIKQCIETDKRMQPKTERFVFSNALCENRTKKSGRRNHKKSWKGISADTLTETDLSQVV